MDQRDENQNPSSESIESPRPAPGSDALETLLAMRQESAKYFLKRNGGKWCEVSMVEFAFAERSCGFIPKPGCGPLATDGFGYSGNGVDIQGRIEYAPLNAPAN